MITAASGEQPVIVAEDVVVVYGQRAALRGVSFSVKQGERILVRGQNGAGKSTLIRVLAGLQRMYRGSVHIHGAAPTDQAVRRRLGVVSHSPWLDPDLTAEETLQFYGALYSVPALDARALEMLERVAMADRQDQRVAELSRGYQQRLTLARALLPGPDVLLLDEPDTGLDEETLELMQALLTAPCDDRQPTIVLTSHNRAFGTAIADRVLTLEAGRLGTSVEPGHVIAAQP